MIKLTLPYSPSANRYWRHFRGNVIVSAEAKLYKRNVGILCLAARVKPIVGDVAMQVKIYRPQKSGDLGNRIKVLEDALQGYAYADDKQIAELHAFRFDDKNNPRLEVEIWPLK